MNRAPLSERLYRALLRLFPAEFRGDFGDQMTDDFRDQHDEMARRGRPWHLWAQTIAGVVSRAPREHADVLWRDALYAVRQLTRRRGATLGAMAALAVGLGLNTAVFSLAATVLWRPLPFPDSERLVAVQEISADPAETQTDVSSANFVDWEARSRTLVDLALTSWTARTIAASGDPQHLDGARVSARFFQVFATRPERGRLFTAADYAQVATAQAEARARNTDAVEPSVAIVSYDVWQQMFGGRDDAIGATVRIGRHAAEIVGVLPRDFSIPGSETAQFWQPMVPDPQQRRARYLNAFGRLAPGISIAQAQAEFEVISIELAGRYPRANKDHRARVIGLRDTVASGVRSHLWLLLGAAVSVLLIASASVGNLLLAQTSGRRLEFATRAALGATRARLVRQLLTESFILAGLGGVAGLLLARWALPALVAAAPPGMPRLSEVSVDDRAVWFTLLASCAVGLSCGAIACAATSRASFASVRPATGATAHSKGQRFRMLLTVGEIALALTLVIGTGLLVRTLQAVAGLDLGFVPTNVLSVGLNPEQPQYQQPGAKDLFETELVSRVRQLPGVIAAGIGTRPLGAGSFGNSFEVPGIAGHVGSLDVVSPGYLEALGGTLAAGRFFTADDTGDRPRVAIVNQSAAAAWWPGASPLGRTLLYNRQPTVIVGVLADVRRRDLEAAPVPTVYAPTAQMPNHWTNNLIIRTSGDARAILPAVREVMRSIDRQQALARIQTLEERLREVTAPRRQLLWLVGFFSALSLGLAIVGVYGVVAESVAQRVREIGIRIALGATRPNVMSLILRQGLWLASAGTVIGVAVAMAFNQVMSGFVFGVATTDPSTYAAACLCIAGSTMAACAFPALRAARVDPVLALKHE